MVATGKAAEFGILVKSAAALEGLGKVDTVVLDKTGTITTGNPSVTDIVTLDGRSANDFLGDAAALESGSAHPLAQAIINEAKRRSIAIPALSDFTSESGLGVRGVIHGRKYFAGNKRFFDEKNIDVSDVAQELIEKLAKEGKTPMLFAKDGTLVGIIAAADKVREDSAGSISRLRAMGIRTVMLTGDNKVTAEAVRGAVGVDEVISDVLPADKEACVSSLKQKGHKVAMVGDGINDAPALVSADIGIAIGAGTDIAIDSADIVLMKSSLSDVVTAIKLSRATVRNIKMNLFWAFFYNILGIPVAAGVLYPFFAITLSPMIGSAAMSASSVCVVSNALRLRGFKDKEAFVAKNGEEKLAEEKVNEYNADEKENDEMKKTVKIKIDGMMCNHCRMHAEKALAAVEGVASVSVTLEDGMAVVKAARSVSDEALVKAVVDAGYEAKVV
jgi:heavy metal translocating P-type ATPase